jgi:hypothetical protein
VSKKTTTIVSCPFRSSFFLRSRLFFSPPCDRRRQTPMRSSSFSIRSHFDTYPIIPPLFFLIQQDWKHFPQSGSYCEKPSLPARCLHLGIPTAIGACCWLGGTTLGWSSAGRERFSKFCVFPCWARNSLLGRFPAEPACPPTAAALDLSCPSALPVPTALGDFSSVPHARSSAQWGGLAQVPQ